MSRLFGCPTNYSTFLCVGSAKALAPGELPQAIYRATTGKRRIATLVAVADLPTFTSNYSALMKGCMGALKKPKKADKKKTARKATS